MNTVNPGHARNWSRGGCTGGFTPRPPQVHPIFGHRQRYAQCHLELPTAVNKLGNVPEWRNCCGQI